jgi:hypothetical protein
MMIIIHLNLVVRLRMYGAIHLFQSFLWCAGMTVCTLFILRGLAVHRFLTSALDGHVNSVPLLKNMGLF